MGERKLSLDAVLETALYASDLNLAEYFYGSVLGLKQISRVGDRHVFFALQSSMILIFNPSHTVKPASNPKFPVPVHGSQGQGHICFRVSREELPRWIERLRAADVEIEADFEWPSGARSIYFRDPAGNSLELSEPALWGFEDTLS